ncbi:hypothetical protein HDV00_002045 [Rhizophlyctis rosea]|nr:hypothetical protein HDV00_002045 [Rhizophlyctis rosea]
MGTSGASFGPVQRKLKERAPGLATVVYDRAGLGWSHPPKTNGPRGLATLADELHTLLTSGELHALSRASKPSVLRPVILVGHSYGGPIVETYRQNYPTSHIHSIILVDPSPTALFSTLPNLCNKIYNLRRLLPYFSFLGLTRLLVPTLMSHGMFSPKTRYGAALTPTEKSSLYRDMILTPNTLAARNESDMLSGCQALQMQKAALQATGKYATVKHCVVIHGSESKFPQGMSGMPEEEFERRAREERYETGLALSKGRQGEWKGFWVDEGADHMGTVVGELVVEAVLEAVGSVKV